MFHFKNFVMKIMSKSPSRHLVRLQGKLKLTEEIYLHIRKLLGACAKFRNATVSFVMSVGLSAWNNSAPTGRIFMKFDTSIFSKTCRENSSLIKI